MLTIAVVMSTPAFAGNWYDVTIPNDQGGITIGGDALLLQPSSTNTTFNTTDVFGGPVTARIQNTDFNRVDPTYHWGFDATLGYRIPCTGNDIMATWTSLSENSDSESATNPPFSTVTVTTSPTTKALIATTINYKNYVTDSTAEFEYNAVDLNLGQRINFGSRFLLRVFAGARYAQLEQNQKTTINRSGDTVTTTSSGVPVPGTAVTFTTTEQINEDSKFKGIGPEIGLQGRYCLGYGFGIDAGVISSILIGNVDSSEDDNTRTIFPTTTATNNHHTNNNSKANGVPSLDINLGLDYTYNFNNCSRSSVTLQGGYKTIHYWNVTRLVNNGAIFNSVNYATDVTFNGPYLGLRVDI